jgi:hypothetical protein
MANIFRQEYEARWAELDAVSTVTGSAYSFEAFPNPASDILTISNPFPSNAHLQLIDVNGIVRIETPMTGETMRITLPAGLANGLYAIRMSNGGQQVLKKVLVFR